MQLATASCRAEGCGQGRRGGGARGGPDSDGEACAVDHGGRRQQRLAMGREVVFMCPCTFSFVILHTKQTGVHENDCIARG